MSHWLSCAMSMPYCRLLPKTVVHSNVTKKLEIPFSNGIHHNQINASYISQYSYSRAVTVILVTSLYFTTYIWLMHTNCEKRSAQLHHGSLVSYIKLYTDKAMQVECNFWWFAHYDVKGINKEMWQIGTGNRIMNIYKIYKILAL